jgi:hypothetical protein
VLPDVPPVPTLLLVEILNAPSTDREATKTLSRFFAASHTAPSLPAGMADWLAYGEMAVPLI